MKKFSILFVPGALIALLTATSTFSDGHRWLRSAGHDLESRLVEAKERIFAKRAARRKAGRLVLDPASDGAASQPDRSRTAPRQETPSPGAESLAVPAGVDPSVTVDRDLALGASSNIYKDGEIFLWDETGGGNLGVGRNALSANTGGANTGVGTNALKSNIYGDFNTAVGSGALYSNISGNWNTAGGWGALVWNQEGTSNSGFGARALFGNLEGDGNTGVGVYALGSNLYSSYNTAVGLNALRLNSSDVGYGMNTAVGAFALVFDTSGAFNTAMGYRALGILNGADYSFSSFNTAIGHEALGSLESGVMNTALGYGAGTNVQTGNGNIHIASYGSTYDDSVTRIGMSQTATYVAGIHGATTGIDDAIGVLIDSAGQLGTISSSRRAKEGIEDLGRGSENLLDLRPVSFRYKRAFKSGEKPIQYGLIAEEVAEVFPELVVYDDQGRPETVKYHLLSVLLLNELQQHDRELSQLEALRAEVARLRQLETRLARLEVRNE